MTDVTRGDGSLFSVSKHPCNRWHPNVAQLTSCDTETGIEVVDDGEHQCLPLKWDPVGGNESDHGDHDDEDGVQPVDMLIPVLEGYRLVRDMRLLGIELLVCSDGDIVAGAIRESLSLHRGRRR